MKQQGPLIKVRIYTADTKTMQKRILEIENSASNLLGVASEYVPQAVWEYDIDDISINDYPTDAIEVLFPATRYNDVELQRMKDTFAILARYTPTVVLVLNKAA